MGILDSKKTKAEKKLLELAGDEYTKPEALKDAISKCVKLGGNLYVQDEEGNTPLIFSARYGQPKAAKELIKAGADLEKQDKYGNTPIICSAENGYKEVAKELIKAGADLNKQNKYQDTALIKNAKNEYTEAAKELIKAGADLEKQDMWGRTALDCAKHKKDNELVYYIKEAQNGKIEETEEKCKKINTTPSKKTNLAKKILMEKAIQKLSR